MTTVFILILLTYSNIYNFQFFNDVSLFKQVNEYGKRTVLIIFIHTV